MPSTTTLCGAACPERPFAACTWPVGHPPIPIFVQDTGWFELIHADEVRNVWWDAEGVWEFNGTRLPEPSEAAVDDLIREINGLS